MKDLRSAALAMLFALSATGTALASEPGVGTNPGTPNLTPDNNCIAYYSSYYIHNGQATTLGRNAAQGARGAEIKNLQASCAGATGK